MKLISGILGAFLILPVALWSGSQDRSRSSVGPVRLEAMRNMALESSKSGFPVSLPREWGRLVSVQRTGDIDFSLFLENDAGEIHVVNLVQRGNYLYLNSLDDGGVALVIRRH